MLTSPLRSVHNDGKFNNSGHSSLPLLRPLELRCFSRALFVKSLLIVLLFPDHSGVGLSSPRIGMSWDIVNSDSNFFNV